MINKHNTQSCYIKIFYFNVMKHYAHRIFFLQHIKVAKYILVYRYKLHRTLHRTHKLSVTRYINYTVTFLHAIFIPIERKISHFSYIISVKF